METKGSQEQPTGFRLRVACRCGESLPASGRLDKDGVFYIRVEKTCRRCAAEYATMLMAVAAEMPHEEVDKRFRLTARFLLARGFAGGPETRDGK